MLRRFLGYSIVALAIAACSRDDTASARTRDGSDPDDGGVAPRPAVISAPTQPYRVVPVASGGSVGGSVDFDGVFPADEIVRPTSDQAACGNAVTVKKVAHSGSRVVGAIVWLTDIRSGKPLPLERRFDLTNDNCILDPYVQVVFTTGTLNVSNDDRTLHTNRFINVETGRYVAIAPFNDDGEVVPLDKFKQPQEVEVVCEQHSWAHAWLAVLDHPYYATTSSAGAFTIEGIPPGRYRVRAWHPALGFADDSVTITAGQQANIAFRIRGTGANAPVVRPPAPAVDSQLPSASSTPAASSTAPTTPPPANPPPRR